MNTTAGAIKSSRRAGILNHPLAPPGTRLLPMERRWLRGPLIEPSRAALPKRPAESMQNYLSATRFSSARATYRSVSSGRHCTALHVCCSRPPLQATQECGIVCAVALPPFQSQPLSRLRSAIRPARSAGAGVGCSRLVVLGHSPLRVGLHSSPAAVAGSKFATWRLVADCSATVYKLRVQDDEKTRSLSSVPLSPLAPANRSLASSGKVPPLSRVPAPDGRPAGRTKLLALTAFPGVRGAFMETVVPRAGRAGRDAHRPSRRLNAYAPPRSRRHSADTRGEREKNDIARAAGRQSRSRVVAAHRETSVGG